jgi:hypothetical protein
VEISPTPPNERLNEAERIREHAAREEKRRGVFPHPTNGDEALYPHKIGNFTKGLRHNALGEVDPDGYRALLHALKTGNFADFEDIPLGGQQRLLNPMGGLAFNLEGPDSPATTIDPPPAFASAELAAQMAELYWMAVCRDVPFTDYDSDPTIAAAVADLGTFPDYAGPTPVTARNLFRVNYPGVLDGPIVSQFLLQPFRFDGIFAPLESGEPDSLVGQIKPRTRVPLPVSATTDTGIDFLTSYDEWLAAQRGFPTGTTETPRFDRTPRYLRSVRDLGQNAGQDAIYSAFFRAAQILGGFGNAAVDDGNPYKNSTKQSGFATFGSAHLLELVGSVHKAERHAWYQKWNVHRFLRPEAFSGRVHNQQTGAASYPIHHRLLSSPVLDRIFQYNRQINQRRGIGGGQGTFLLPILFPTGSPTHPSFPAGHSISAGACVSILKAWFKEDFPIPDPVKPRNDGSGVDPYVVGVDGPQLTVGGELNKLAHNLSLGRDMSGVHWRADDIQGNRQGEEVAIRILREARATLPEPFGGFIFTKFDGTLTTI